MCSQPKTRSHSLAAAHLIVWVTRSVHPGQTDSRKPEPGSVTLPMHLHTPNTAWGIDFSKLLSPCQEKRRSGSCKAASITVDGLHAPVFVVPPPGPIGALHLKKSLSR